MTATEPDQQQVMVQPVPLQFGVGQAVAPDGSTIVILQIATPIGVLTFPLDGAAARKVGVDLQQAGSAAATGLLIAGAGSVPKA